MNKKMSFFYFIMGAVLLIGGFLDAIYLAVSHYRAYTDIEYSSFCAISKSFNCDTVSQSSFSILFGLPIPIWGVLGYLLLILIFPFIFYNKNTEKRLWNIFFIISALFFSYSIILAVISTFFIHSYCLMCIVLYAINLSLFIYSYKGIKNLGNGRVFKGLLYDWFYLKTNAYRLFLIIKLFSAAVILLWLVFPKYWLFEFKEENITIASGVTEDGNHWIGAREPEITIIEYSDYLCFQCKKMHFHLRSLVVKNPYKIRLVHRHFPLDSRFNFSIKETLHPGAGKMAMIAIYAGLKDRFWEMNDLLYNIDHSKNTIDLKEIALKMNLTPEELGWALEQQEIRLHLKRDIAMAAKAGVVGTPSYIINNELFLGTIPPKYLKFNKN
ncbi:MAG: vitamin K epoxide reductase family protein [Desulfobacula sp.]|jgi:protein-disulfide isomerase/uncharacterized membrane protein